MGCGISTIDSFEEAKTKNELLTLVLKEKNVYSQRLLNEKLDKETKVVVIDGKIIVNENPIEIFVEGINVIERNLKSNNEYTEINQLGLLLEEYFKLGDEKSTNAIFTMQKRIEQFFYKNCIVKPKNIVNQNLDNQFPGINNIPQNQFPPNMDDHPNS